MNVTGINFIEIYKNMTENFKIFDTFTNAVFHSFVSD